MGAEVHSVFVNGVYTHQCVRVPMLVNGVCTGQCVYLSVSVCVPMLVNGVCTCQCVCPCL